MRLWEEKKLSILCSEEVDTTLKMAEIIILNAT